MAYNICISWGPKILNRLCTRIFYMAHYYEGGGRADLKVPCVPTDAGPGIWTGLRESHRQHLAEILAKTAWPEMNIGPKRKPCRGPQNFLNRPSLRWGWGIFFNCYPSLGESQKRTVQSLWQLSEVLDFTQPQRLFAVFKNRHYSTPHTPISVPSRITQPRRLFLVFKNGHYNTPHRSS